MAIKTTNHARTIVLCHACGGDGKWHLRIAPTPDTEAVRVYDNIMCPVCHGSGRLYAEAGDGDADEG